MDRWGLTFGSCPTGAECCIRQLLPPQGYPTLPVAGKAGPRHSWRGLPFPFPFPFPFPLGGGCERVLARGLSPQCGYVVLAFGCENPCCTRFSSSGDSKRGRSSSGRRSSRLANFPAIKPRRCCNTSSPADRISAAARSIWVGSPVSRASMSRCIAISNFCCKIDKF